MVDKKGVKEEIIEKPGLEKTEKPEKEVAAKTKAQSRAKEMKSMRVIVRVLGTDLDGEKSVSHAILRIKGVSYSFANALCKAANIDPHKKLGSFTESELAELEKAIKEPSSIGIPLWIENRRKDNESGKDLHVSGTDVDVAKKFDIQRMVDQKTYKGVRHMLGLPVRGQRTRSSFRHGKAVGVVRKSVRLAAGAGAATTAGVGVTKEAKKEK
jgi:small subunit ribosomal protein S13